MLISYQCADKMARVDFIADKEDFSTLHAIHNSAMIGVMAREIVSALVKNEDNYFKI